MDLNQLANQLASGLEGGQFAEDPKPEPSPLAPGPRQASPRGVQFTDEPIRLGSVLDHTLLDPAATAADIERHCEEARVHRVAAVCVNAIWVRRCAELLQGSGIAVASVVGFPFGALPPAVKAAEAAAVVDLGATELETVIPLGLVKGGDWRALYEDVAAVVQGASGALVKVILETARLTPMELLRTASVVSDAGADYVKTSTGYSAAGGATPEAVALLRLAVGDDVGVKASGGVRDAEAAFRLLESGATRIGTSVAPAFADAVGPGPRRLHDLMHAPLRDEEHEPPRAATTASLTRVQQPVSESGVVASPGRTPPGAGVRITPAWGAARQP